MEIKEILIRGYKIQGKKFNKLLEVTSGTMTTKK